MKNSALLPSQKRKAASGEKKQYFIALPLPERLSREITEVKNAFAELYEARHALKLRPHITLVAPFRAPLDLEESLRSTLHGLAAGQAPFRVYLNGFGCFRHRGGKVIFIRVTESDRLQSLHADLVALFGKTIPGLKLRGDLPFHPHLTIAHRDLSASAFEKAWPAYQDMVLQSDFEADSLVLFRHDGQRWQALQSVALTGK